MGKEGREKGRKMRRVQEKGERRGRDTAGKSEGLLARLAFPWKRIPPPDPAS